jgi:hypothetical protein
MPDRGSATGRCIKSLRVLWRLAYTAQVQSLPVSSIMNLLKNFLLFIFVYGLAALAFAQAQPQFSAEHLAAAERVVYAMGLPERFIIPTSEMIKVSKTRDPDNADLMNAVFASYLDKHYTGEQLKPYFASLFDPDMCRQIAAFWEGPVGQKLVKTKVQLLSGGEPPALVYNRREKAIIKQFEKTAAGKAMLAAMPSIEETFADYTNDTQMKMREEFLRQLEKKIKNGS